MHAVGGRGVSTIVISYDSGKIIREFLMGPRVKVNGRQLHGRGN